VLRQDPFSGQLFVFRGRKANLIKIVFWDGTGLCLFTKRLEHGHRQLLRVQRQRSMPSISRPARLNVRWPEEDVAACCCRLRMQQTLCLLRLIDS
jgi:transposase